jgi:hypothetical protein
MIDQLEESGDALLLRAIYVNTGNGFAQKESGFSSNPESATLRWRTKL